MDLSRLLQMLLQMFLRKAVNKAVSKGVDIAASRGKSGAGMTPSERVSARKTRELAGHARRLTNLLRRIGR